MPEKRKFLNYYSCPVCGTQWEDVWESTCSDRCPNCRAEIEPHKIEDIGPHAALRPALQGLLIAGEKARDDVLSGRKKTTIREGHRDYRTGPVLIGCHILGWVHLTGITSVRHTTLKDVTPGELVECFQSGNHQGALDQLRRFYPEIGPHSPVTVISWK